MVLWELLTWALPWPKDNPWAIVHMVSNGGRLEIPLRWNLPGSDTANFSGLADYLDLLQRCWAHNPYDRPTFAEVITTLRTLTALAPAAVAAAAAGPLAAGSLEGAPSDDFVTEEMLSMQASISSVAAATDSIMAGRTVDSQQEWASRPR